MMKTTDNPQMNDASIDLAKAAMTKALALAGATCSCTFDERTISDTVEIRFPVGTLPNVKEKTLEAVQKYHRLNDEPKKQSSCFSGTTVKVADEITDQVVISASLPDWSKTT